MIIVKKVINDKDGYYRGKKSNKLMTKLQLWSLSLAFFAVLVYNFGPYYFDWVPESLNLTTSTPAGNLFEVDQFALGPKVLKKYTYNRDHICNFLLILFFKLFANSRHILFLIILKSKSFLIIELLK